MQVVDIVSDSVEAVWNFTSGFGGGPLVARNMTATVLPLIHNHRWSVRHIFRELNCIADELAKNARQRGLEWSRLDALPVEVQQCNHLYRDSYV